MTVVFRLKSNNTIGATPANGSIETGELAINLADRVLFSKDASNAVFSLTTPAANTTVSGRVRLATPEETITGTSSTIAATPEGVAAILNDYTPTSGLAAVATSGAYGDLSDTPSLADVATSGAYSDLSGTPTLGTIASQNANSVTITGGSISGITDLAVADGGTGASDASGARTNLGLAIGTNVQAYSADLAAIAGLAKTDGNFIVGNGSTWVAESGSTARTSLGLGALATLGSIDNSNWSGADLAVVNGGTGASDAGTARTNLGVAIGSDVQAYNALLASIAGQSMVADRLIYGTGTGTVGLATLTSFARTLLDDANDTAARATLGLGSLATASTINNANWSGTDLAIEHGGTGASSASAARTNLGLAIGSDVQAFNNNLAQLAGLSDPNADRLLFWDDSANTHTYASTGTGLSITGTTMSVVAPALLANVDASLTAGFTATAANDGTKSSGTYRPTPVSGNLRRAVNGGAHTLAAPNASGDYTLIVQYTNSSGAGAITMSGFTQITGDAFTTTNGHGFLVFITKINNLIHAHVQALQ